MSKVINKFILSKEKRNFTTSKLCLLLHIFDLIMEFFAKSCVPVNILKVIRRSLKTKLTF